MSVSGDDMPELTNDQDLIDDFLALLPQKGNTSSLSSIAVTSPSSEVVQPLLEHGRTELLWDGVWQFQGSPYPSQSEADFALLGGLVRQCRKLGVPKSDVAAAVLTAFEQSGLYRADKQRRVETQDIPNLIASEYDATHVSQSPATGNTSPQISKLSGGRINLSPNLPLPRDYVVEDLIIAGKVAVLGGLGGVSKTMCAMTLAARIALGRDFLDKSVKEGCALLILGEEDQSEIDRRFNAICHDMNLAPNELQLVQDRVRAFPLNGMDARLTKISNGNLEGTEFTAEIVAATQRLEQEASLPVTMVALDHAGLIHGGDFNSREDVVQTMRQAGVIAGESGAAVIVLAHSPKNSIGKENSDQGDVAGSAAWVDLARAVFMMRTMTEAEGKPYGIPKVALSSHVSLSVVKNNYGPGDQSFWLMRQSVHGYGVSVLREVTLTPVPTVSANTALRTKVKAFIQTHPGQYSKTKLRDTRSGKNGEFKASKHDVEAAVDDLIATGELRLRPPTDAERKKFGLRPQVVQVLEAI